MSLSTYADLVSAVSNWLHRADLGNVVPDLISLGEKHVYRTVRHRHMEQPFSSAIANSVIPVPDGYVELKNAYVNTQPVQYLQRKNLEFIYTRYPDRSGSGPPVFIAREAGNFIFGPSPDSAYTIKGTYYVRFPPLSSSLNNLFLDHPGLWLYGALMASAPFLKNDDRVDVWGNMFAAEVAEVNSENKREEFSGSSLSVSAG